jgi:short-subunit dehydrogenase
MPGIIKATEDIDIPIIFNNAGYIVTGFFDQTTLDAQLANVECNATATVKVTHHFLKKMLAKDMKGCIVFTSSPSGYIPNPFAVMYGATKAFVSQFAASLAIEVKNNGIDVLAVHPSPVNSQFFNNAHKLDSLEMAKQAAVNPNEVPEKMLACVGRAHLGDLGQLAVIVRVVVALVPYDFLTQVFALAAPFMDDYNKHNKNRGGKKE